MIGKLLDGRYQIIQDLGGGSFSRTYIAEDTRRPGQPKCVLKHLRPTVSDPDFLPTAKRLFTSEAEALEKLGNYDRIPRLLAYLEENQELYLVQEFIEGHPLSAELPLGFRWQEQQVIQLLLEGLSILEFIHSRGVIHRDIKPNNLIRRESDNQLVLIDFGAVKQIQPATVSLQAQPAPTVAIGTPGYLPTEQSQGRPRFSSDIYALGIIGIQALTGVSPDEFEADNDTGEIIWQHLATVSPGLAHVLTQMVKYHFKDRYQTATEALQAVRKLPSQRQFKLYPNGILAVGAVAIGTAIAVLALGLLKPTDSLKQSTRSSTTSSSSQNSLQQPSPTKQSATYSQLQADLKQSNWQAADQTTYELMLKIAGPNSQRQGYFDLDEWKNFPCDDFREIDQLWRKASNQSLGFSAQKKIFESVKKQDDAYYKKIRWKTAAGKLLVSWNYNKALARYEYLPNQLPNFNTPPNGHLPAKLQWSDGIGHRFDKVYSCRL